MCRSQKLTGPSVLNLICMHTTQKHEVTWLRYAAALKRKGLFLFLFVLFLRPCLVTVLAKTVPMYILIYKNLMRPVHSTVNWKEKQSVLTFYTTYIYICFLCTFNRLLWSKHLCIKLLLMIVQHWVERIPEDIG